MEQAESNLDSLRVFTTEKRFVQLGMAARGIACGPRARFVYWSMTTSDYKIHFTRIAEKVRPFIDICHPSCLRELLAEFRESRRMGSV
jgi:hypothetical protein